MSITRLNYFTANQSSIEELGSFLKSLIPYISNSEGCISCEVLQNQDEMANYVVVEKWENIEAHQQSVANFPKKDMQEAMGLLACPPSGSYYNE